MSEKKWATRQSFIRKEITTYRIGTLEIGTINDFLIKAKQINLEQAYLGINKVE